MAYEGEHKSIPIRGIERAASDNVVADGAMNEVINLLPRNGSLTTYVPTDIGLEKSNGTIMVYVHHTSTGDNVIEVKENSYAINGEYVDTQTMKIHYKEVYYENGRCGIEAKERDVEILNTTYSEKKIEDVVFIGNRMDILTDKGIEHWLWKNGAYENISDLSDKSSDISDKLPSVDFKVRRGIYDGSNYYASARYAQVEKEYAEGLDKTQENKHKASAYVHDKKNIGADMTALLAAVRAQGGITGYVLVAAAYMKKGSTAEKPQYIMASPILLMGAPEIYVKDKKWETNSGYIDRYNKDKTYMLDMFDYDNRVFPWNVAYSQKKCFADLWKMESSDNKTGDDITEGETVSVDLQKSDKADKCFVRTIPETSIKEYTESYQSNCGQVYQRMTKVTIQPPALYGQKYAMYNHGNWSLGTYDDNAEHKAIRISHASANILSLKLNGEIKKEYKDEISDTLCILISPIVSPFNTDGSGNLIVKTTFKSDTPEDQYDGFYFCEEVTKGNYKMNESACGGSFIPEMKAESKIIEELRQIAGLYKVKEINLKDINPNEWIDIELKGKISTDKLIQNTDTMLKIENLTPVSIVRGNIFGYNERLHIYNYQKKEVYRLNYKNLHYLGGEGQYKSNKGNLYEYSVEVRDSKDSLICTRFTSSYESLNPLIAHNDIDARSITIAKRFIRNGRFYVGRVSFTPQDIASTFSGYIATDLKPLNIQCTEVTEHTFSSAFQEERISTDADGAYGANEIRVSGVGDTVFEAKNHYKVGNGQIIALARMTMGLSQDNYGKYPLIVFCSDGIYTLDVDTTGNAVYNMQSPLSRFVCTNVNGICELDGSVVFPSDDGLHIITTDGVKPIVQYAIGNPKGTPNDNSGLTVYKNAINHTDIVELNDSISTIDFLDYINSQETRIRYLYTINHLICYNKNIPYCYMIDISTWAVTKQNIQIDFDNRDFPKQTFWMIRKPRISITVSTQIDDEQIDNLNYDEARSMLNEEDLLREDLTKEIEEKLQSKIEANDAALAILREREEWSKDADYIIVQGVDKSNLKSAASEFIDTQTFVTDDSRKRTAKDIVNRTIDSIDNSTLLEISNAVRNNLSKQGFTSSDFTWGITDAMKDELKIIKTYRLEDIDTTISENQDTINQSITNISNLQYIQENIDYGSANGISVEDEKRLAAYGLKSVNAMLADEKEGKADYTKRRERLVEAQLTEMVGSVNKENLFALLGFGKNTIVKIKGYGVYLNYKETGRHKPVSEEYLNNYGIVLPDKNITYRINISSTTPVAVQFNHATGNKDVECLLQSRVIKLDSTHVKSSYRIVLRGVFENTGERVKVVSKNGYKHTVKDEEKLYNFSACETVVLKQRKIDQQNGDVIQFIDSSFNVVELSKIGLMQDKTSAGIFDKEVITIVPCSRYAGMYVFGSLDGEHWQLIGAEEKRLSKNRFHDIGVETYHVSMRYMMVVFAGMLSENSRIDGLEITSNPRYVNKLK